MRSGICQCGCGLPAPLARDNNATLGYVKGQPLKFRKGHRPARGKYRVRMIVPGRVKATHIVIAESALGRPLPRGCEVHHVDGDTRNNANSNLVICENGTYHKLLHARARVVRAGGDPNTERKCGMCGRVKPFADFAACRRQNSGLQTNCRTCSAEASRRRREARRAA